MLAASLSYKVFENAVKCAITKVEIGEMSSLTEPQSRSLFNFLCGDDTFLSLPTGHGKYLIRHPLHSNGTLSTSQIIFSTKLSNLLHDDLIFLIQGFDPSATRPTYTARINIAVDSLLLTGFQLLTKALCCCILNVHRSPIRRGGEWYLEKRGSRKILAGSRNLGSVFDKSRSLVFAWFVFTFLSLETFDQRVSGSDF